MHDVHPHPPNFLPCMFEISSSSGMLCRLDSQYAMARIVTALMSRYNAEASPQNGHKMGLCSDLNAIFSLNGFKGSRGLVWLHDGCGTVFTD